MKHSSIEFVKAKIDLLVGRFSNLQCRYEIDNLAGTHIVEILPSSVYDFDQDYSGAESEIIDQFIATFPYENICFVTTGSLIGISNPIYVKEGINYSLLCLMLKYKLMDIPWANKLQFKIPSFFSMLQNPEPNKITSMDSVIFNSDSKNFAVSAESISFIGTPELNISSPYSSIISDNNDSCNNEDYDNSLPYSLAA